MWLTTTQPNLQLGAWLLGNGRQGQPGDAESQVDTRLTLHAERLQDDGFTVAANQYVGAGADAGCDVRRSASELAAECFGRQLVVDPRTAHTMTLFPRTPISSPIRVILPAK